MKKVLAIISAGILAALAFSSCVKEEQPTFDYTKATAPVLGNYTIGEEEITAKFTPGAFNMGFNEEMPVNHALAIVSFNGEAVSKTLTTTNKDGVLTLKLVNLAKALISLGATEGSTADVELAVRATMQDVARDNGINGHVDSEGHIRIASFQVVIPEIVGSPYADYLEDSDWTVIGSLSAYGISWDGDLNMWTDGSGNHVAAHVTLKADDEFKFRKDQAWTVNMGGDFGGLDNEFGVTQDGPNIKVGADGVYDLYVNPDSGIAWITEAYDPYPDFTEASNWSVIGALSKHGISWDGDLAMITDGVWHVALSVNLAGDDEFKFRQDASWSVNLGGEFGGLDNEFEVTQDGPNIKVGAEGTYDLFVNPGSGMAKVSEASGAKVSAKLGGEEPGPGPEPVTGWNIIGLNGDWENDIRATQDGDLWTAYITAEGDTEFKWRKDGGWDENYGGVLVALGEPFEAVPGGDNIKIGAGFWKVVLDTANLTITVSDGVVWSLIGDFNEWAGDVDMTLTEGKWVSPATKLEGGFKIRKNHDWGENVGGTFAAVGEPFAAVAGGDNITVPAGTYMVTYDPEAATIVVDELGWGLVGTINGWGGTPDIMLKEDGNFLVAKNVTLTADDEVKIRYNQDWADNRGGKSLVGVPVQAVPGGDNIKPGAGTFDIYYRPNSEVIIVAQAGSELSYWGVVGTINGWGGTPDILMYQNDEGLLQSAELELAASDEIKIRMNEAWGSNRGGSFKELGEAIEVTQDGPNIMLGRPAKVTIIYNAEAETITVAGEYTGETPPQEPYSLIGWHAGDSWTTNVELIDVEGQPDWRVAKYIGANGGNIDFKFRRGTAWVPQIGAELKTPKNVNELFKVSEKTDGAQPDPANIHLEGDGVYDVYLNEKELTCFILDAGSDFAIPTTWESGATPEMDWYIIGEAVGGWDAENDVPLLDEGEGFYVARSVTILGEKSFKFRANHAWTYQLTCPGLRTPGITFDLEDGNGSGNDMQVAADGVYDVFLSKDLTQGLIVGVGEPAKQVLFLNEFDTTNKKLEIYNASDKEIDMTGWTLSKDETVWTIPAEHAKVPAKGYIVYTGKSDGTLDPTFGLSGTKGFIVVLKDKDGNEVDKVDNSSAREGGIVQIPDGKSWGRKTDGADEFVIFDTPTIGAPNGAAAAEVKITIDGDMSDWASVKGEETPDNICKEMKVYNDDENFYVYLRSEPGGRGNALWGEEAGYYYIDFDWDNDDTTGIPENKNPGFDCWLYMYVFGGTADAPFIKEHPNGHGEAMSIENLTAKGVITAEMIEIELSIPRADMVAVEAGTVTRILSWRSKDGTKIQMNYTVR